MATQLGKTFAIAMCDVDRFKSFNDTYGHDAGDQVGLAERSHRHSTPELVLDAADAALYLAKEAGRNCVRIADSAGADRHRPVSRI